MRPMLVSRIDLISLPHRFKQTGVRDVLSTISSPMNLVSQVDLHLHLWNWWKVMELMEGFGRNLNNAPGQK
jgi:hypothetical protein